ncbi:hypothetical protein FH972_027030 [Carpinus fangiana]|uniref:Uncharacterized protein n=1 Tax=Carpinus fangiana TaxID=176857 RepID=A0A5N6L6I4_9ROSI|nr:hypothetical protein FH972_027030 [Carpinus fangiana]
MRYLTVADDAIREDNAATGEENECEKEEICHSKAGKIIADNAGGHRFDLPGWSGDPTLVEYHSLLWSFLSFWRGLPGGEDMCW